jgi:hypothetical protein
MAFATFWRLERAVRNILSLEHGVRNILEFRTWRSQHSWASLGPSWPMEGPKLHATFLTQKDVPNVLAANPRQTPAFVFAFKTPTKLKINVNPTKLYKLHATLLTQKDVPNDWPQIPGKPRHLFLPLKPPPNIKST